MTKIDELKRRLARVTDLNMAGALLGWDQSTYMPSGGAAARGRQLATLSTLAHEHLTDPRVGELIADLEADSLDAASDDAALVRVARRDYDQATRVPGELLGQIAEHTAVSYAAWTVARPNNDFASMRPHLERTVTLSRELANCFPHAGHIADPLIDMADYGMRADTIKQLFAELRAGLVPLVQAVTAQPLADEAPLRQHFPTSDQLAFGLMVAERYGYDLQRGRQDLTHHPFAVRIGHGDVRITTRVQETDLGDALFSTLHEAGHAMYEQGVDPAVDGTPLASGTSAGVHESQSRLWENIVGRSRAFWTHFYPELQRRFPSQLGATPLDAFYRAINRVAPSLIRVDADELTYNLHVIIRFDLELALLSGDLPVADLPGAWRERYARDLGITPPDDRDGCLQDVHWYAGLVGGQFQGYTLGNILSAQFYNAAVRAVPDIPAAIGRGEFSALHGWLRSNIYQHGRKLTAPDVVRHATSEDLQIAPYLAYLQGKYAELYGL